MPFTKFIHSWEILYFAKVSVCFSTLSAEEKHLGMETCRCSFYELNVLCLTKMKQGGLKSSCISAFLIILFQCIAVWTSHLPCLKQLKNKSSGGGLSFNSMSVRERWLGYRSKEWVFPHIQKRSLFLSLSTIGMLGRIMLWCARCLVHCRLFSSIFGLYPVRCQ